MGREIRERGPGNRKGQMFVLTMVFLVGLVFVIQQGFISWFGYSVDLHSGIQRNDYYLFENVKSMAGQTLLGSGDCDSARDNLNDLRSFLNSRILRGYSLDFKYRLYCSNWNNLPPSPAPLNVTIHVTGEETDTHGDFLFYRF